MQNSESMTLKELRSVIAEGAGLLEGRRVAAFSEVLPPVSPGVEGARTDLFVLLLEDEESVLPRILRLLVSLTPGLNYMLISPRRQRRPKKEARLPFARTVEAAIGGGRVSEISLHGRDRVVTLSIEGREGSELSLVAELFDRRGNIVLLDESGTVLAAFRESRSGSRIIAPGRPYAPPPPAPAGPRSAAARKVRFGPALAVAGGGGRPRGAAGGMVPGIEINGRADLFFKKLEEERLLEGARKNLRRGIGRLRKRVSRRIAAREKLLGEAAKAEEYKKMGDLLKTRFHLLARGMKRIEAPDVFSGGGKRVVIPLDPAREPAANLESFYRRYRKLKAGIPHLERLVAADRRLLGKLDEAAAAAEAAASLEETARISAECLPAGKGGAGRGAGGRIPPSSEGGRDGKRKKKEIPGVKRFRIPGGRVLLAGRDGSANHELLKAARGRDIWLHCHDTPGAHVVIPLERGETAPLEALVAAGLLALHFSKRRGAEKADVIYTERKYVRPVKGGHPGRVVVERFKTLRIRSDPERLGKILEGAEN